VSASSAVAGGQSPLGTSPGGGDRISRRRTNLFGSRNWNDVRGVVTARLRRKFPTALQNDIEDAVAWAMVDLVDGWIEMPSSVDPDNPERTFWYACKRGAWQATTFLTQEWDVRDLATEELSVCSDDFDRNLLPLAPSAEDVALRRRR
jgi:hypothetical protein